MRLSTRLVLAFSVLSLTLVLVKPAEAGEFSFTPIATVSNPSFPAINNLGVVAYSQSIYVATSTSGTVLQTGGEFSYFSPFPSINDSNVVAIETVLTNNGGRVATTRGLRLGVGGGSDLSNTGLAYFGGSSLN